MSRIGKMPVTVPMGVEVTIEGQTKDESSMRSSGRL